MYKRADGEVAPNARGAPHELTVLYCTVLYSNASPPRADPKGQTDADAAKSSKEKAGSRRKRSPNYCKYTERIHGARLQRRKVTRQHWGARKGTQFGGFSARGEFNRSRRRGCHQSRTHLLYKFENIFINIDARCATHECYFALIPLSACSECSPEAAPETRRRSDFIATSRSVLGTGRPPNHVARRHGSSSER